MKKICFVITDAVSFNYLMKGQLEYLSNKGHDLTLVCGGSEEQINKLISRNVGRVKLLPFSRKISVFNDFFCLVRLWFFLCTNRFDSVVYSTPKALLLTSIASFLSFSKNRICIFRGRVYENYQGNKLKFFRLLDMLAIKLSSEIVFISSSLKEQYIMDCLVERSRARVIASGSSNGVDVNGASGNHIDTLKDYIKNRIDYSEGDFIVTFLGRHCLDKGIEQWSEIVNKLSNIKNVKFVSAGSVEDNSSQEIIDTLTKRSNYYYLNQVESVYPILMLAHLHVFLSHREGFGNVAIEAALLGVPTFAYDVTGVRDSVNQKSGQLFPFLDTEKIVAEIRNLILNDSIESRFDKTLMRKWVIDNFEQTYVWSEYEKLYTRES